MTGTITWEQVIALVGLIGALIALWARIENLISVIRDSLADYKVLVATNYPQKSELRESVNTVEIRIAAQVANISMNLTEHKNTMTNEMRGLRESIEKMLLRNVE